MTEESIKRIYLSPWKLRGCRNVKKSWISGESMSTGIVKTAEM
jgi:hypothetical protein